MHRFENEGTCLQGLARNHTDYVARSISVNLGSLAETQSVAISTVTVQDVAIFAQVSEATTASRQLELDYWTASRSVQARRVVDPYPLTLLDGSWFLVAWCHSRRGVRTFAVQRMRSARPTGAAFEQPADFRIADYVRHSFRSMRGDGSHEVVLRFTPVTARSPARFFAAFPTILLAA